jgi:hypothetical protein
MRRTLRVTRVLAAVAWIALATARPARADGRFEIGGGFGWASGHSLGSRETTITGGQVPAGLPVVIFASDVSMEGGPRGEIALGWHLTRGLVLEAMGTLSGAQLASRVRGDIEGAPALTVRSSLLQVTAEGGARLELPWSHGRLTPFVSGSGGYLRHVHERRLLVETGTIFSFGGGIVVAPPTPARGVLGRVGYRADVRGIARSGGADIEDTVRIGVAVSGGAFFRF